MQSLELSIAHLKNIPTFAPEIKKLLILLRNGRGNKSVNYVFNKRKKIKNH